MIAVDFLPHLEAEARARQARAVANRHAENRGVVVERIPPLDHDSTGKARDHAAAAVGVNPRYVSDAKKIRETAPALAEKVRAGQITIPQA